MRAEALPKPGGFKDYVAKNPLIFAAFVFPTVTTGILILVKPNLRAQFLGMYRKENASVKALEAAPAAVYDISGEASGDEGGANAPAGDEGRASPSAEEGDAASKGAQGDVADDGWVVVENDSEMKGEETAPSASVADLLHSIGIRPHPSS